MEMVYGGHDLQEYEKNSVGLPPLRGDENEHASLSARPDPKAAQSYTWAMDVPKHTDTWRGYRHTAHSAQRGNTTPN
jgi:hypothetical protein